MLNMDLIFFSPKHLGDLDAQVPIIRIALDIFQNIRHSSTYVSEDYLSHVIKMVWHVEMMLGRQVKDRCGGQYHMHIPVRK